MICGHVPIFPCEIQVECCKTPSDDKLWYLFTESCKVENYQGSVKIRSLKGKYTIYFNVVNLVQFKQIRKNLNMAALW